MLLLGVDCVRISASAPPLGFEPKLHGSKGRRAAITPGRIVPSGIRPRADLLRALSYLATRIKAMEIVQNILVILHLIGMAMIVGGYLVTVKAPRVLPGMLHAAGLQVVTGVLLFGMLEMQGSPTMSLRAGAGIKILLGLVALIAFIIGNKREKAAASAGAVADGTVKTAAPSAAMAHTGFIAAVLAVIVAVFTL